MFFLKSTGIDSGNDEATIKTKNIEIEKSLNGIKYATSDDEIVSIMGKLCSGQTVEKIKMDVFGDEGVISKISYRPFEDRYTYYSGISCGWLSRPRDPKIMKSLINVENNIALVYQKQSNKKWADIFVTSSIIDSHLIGSKSYVAPLYIDRDDLTGNAFDNFDKESFDQLICNLITKPTPREVFNYCYGVLYSKTYRNLYNEFLKQDSPKIPIPNNQEYFDKYANAGSRLIELHLVKTSVQKELGLNTTESQNLLIEQVKFVDGKVLINKDTSIGGITEAVWNYYIGGYQVIDKWLKLHKNETLDYEKFNHLKKIVGIIEETIKIQQEI